MDIKTVNLEQGMPTVEEALSRMEQAVRTAKMAKIPAIKLIHGYGSSGRGGAIRTGVRRRLETMKRQGRIKLYVSGEEFSPFYEDARKALDAVPGLSSDRDYARTNQGVTIVVL